jgi:hypothetical protein
MKSDWLTDDPPATSKRGKMPTYLIFSLVSGAAIGLVVLGVLFAGDPKQLFALKGGGVSGGAAEGAAAPYKLLGAAALDPKDPAVRFSETGIGQVMFATPNSDKCRRVLFDNRTGTSYWVRDVDCGRPAEQPEVSNKVDRFLAVKNSFRH